MRDGIFAALQNMAHGISSCMYCGHHMADTIDHYVPVSENPVRTFCWSNHLLACSTCNSRYKLDKYEKNAFGTPSLVDPTREDPFTHLHLNLDTGLYEGLTARGEYTIKVCGLNERRLPDARMRARRDIILHLEGWACAIDNGDESRAKDFTAAVREQPFSDVCQAMLRQAQHPASELLFAAFPDLLSLLRRPGLSDGLIIHHVEPALSIPEQRGQHLEAHGTPSPLRGELA
ncbi:HNH endonuclease [Streptomyces sp. LN549]|uniref:HNH endonuclease n=1 Tax=Streptomyces sp. LN549 TaxID=3112979 RepID=UPI0037141809